MKVGWNNEVSESIPEPWLRWPSELSQLTTRYVPRCYYDWRMFILTIQFHGFSDASEWVYSAMIYLRIECTNGSVQVALVLLKTKVAPIKRLTIPNLELCRAQLLTRLLHHIGVHEVPLDQSHTWTDSTIVLHWLFGRLGRFKTYVGNRVFNIVELIGPGRAGVWRWCRAGNSWHHTWTQEYAMFWKQGVLRVGDSPFQVKYIDTMYINDLVILWP